MERFEGRVAVVTGGASGIGRGIAEAMAGRGMKIVLADVEQAALDTAVAEMGNAGTEVVGIQCDVSSQDSVEALARASLDAFGAVHVLCNNAGVAGSAQAAASWERSLAEWDWVLGVNLMGVVHGLRSFVPILIEQDDEGHIVNTASMAGLIGGGGIYGVSKHGVVSLSETLYGELALRAPKVGVSVLCPGWVSTRIIESERNRPETPREAPGEQAPELERMREVVAGLIRDGLDPREVGDIVVEAAANRTFYVLTHPWHTMVEHRMQNVLQARPPVGLPPPGLDVASFMRQD